MSRGGGPQRTPRSRRAPAGVQAPPQPQQWAGEGTDFSAFASALVKREPGFNPAFIQSEPLAWRQGLQPWPHLPPSCCRQLQPPGVWAMPSRRESAGSTRHPGLLGAGPPGHARPGQTGHRQGGCCCGGSRRGPLSSRKEQPAGQYPRCLPDGTFLTGREAGGRDIR